MECPKCEREIGPATYCGCGWKQSRKKEKAPKDAPLPIVNCAHQDCIKPAIMREKTATGWANLCHFHMMQRSHDRAEKYCSDRGLDTLQKKKDFIRQCGLGKLVMKQIETAEREPGQDDEELVAGDQA